MPLLLTEQDVTDLLPMDRAIERVEAVFRAQRAGHTANRSRERILLPHISLHYMSAAWPEEKVLGMKIYTITAGAWRFLVLLFDAESGGLLAVIEADHLGRIRTGAASGVATKYLARTEASRVGVIGTGRQARTQLEAVAKVRKLTAARAYGRDENRRREFCREMSAKLALEVEPAASAEAATRYAEILITATNASEPVVFGGWLKAGAHINAIGANMVNRRELDDAALARATLIAVDTLDQAKIEAGDLVQGLAALGRNWADIAELCEFVVGARPGRSAASDITIFKSSGIALWDVAVASYVYKKAVEEGRGRKIDFLDESRQKTEGSRR